MVALRGGYLMYKLFICLIVVLCLGSNVFAAGLDDLVTVVAQYRTSADAFAKDFGCMMAGGAFHQGSNLGLPGFDVGVHMPMKKPNVDNLIVTNAGLETMALPWAQLEIGLPFKLDLIVRGLSGTGLSYSGFGVRYGIFKSKLPLVPSVSAAVLSNSFEHTDFEATTMSVNVVISFKIPFLSPYISVGSDQSTAKFIASGIEGTGASTRIEAGINLGLIPLTYLQIGGGTANGDTIYSGGFGIKF